MNRIPGNYKGKDQGLCSLCNEDEGIIEHYFECRMVKQVRKAWDVQLHDITSNDVKRMKCVSKFMEKVEIMIEPKGVRKFFNVGEETGKCNWPLLSGMSQAVEGSQIRVPGLVPS